MSDSKDVSTEFDPDGNVIGSARFYTYGLGYQYNFSKRTYSWVEGQYVDLNGDDSDDNGYSVRVGLRHDF